ncbi:hypothetical protein ID866_2830 [Astraeus odoratus]|nr:hypothetical protein ID866_2830 [Astraeus odoratus]
MSWGTVLDPFKHKGDPYDTSVDESSPSDLTHAAADRSWSASGATPLPQPTQTGLSPAALFLSAFSPPISHALLPDDEGQSVAGYVLGPVVGYGSFSTIRRASSPSGGIVAIKIVKRSEIQRQSNPTLTRKILDHETQIWSSLNHEHILPLFTVERTPYADFFVTLFCPAGSLFDILKRDGNPALPHDDAGMMFRQVVRGVRYLHEVAGYVHRDIKLENVLVDEMGVCRIGDFGLTRKIGEAEDDFDVNADGSNDHSGSAVHRHRSTVSHTRSRAKESLPSHASTLRRHHRGPRRHRTSTPVGDEPHAPVHPAHAFPAGSLPYAAPELLSPSASGRSVVGHPSHDMWALGVLLYALLTGHLPFYDAFEPRLTVKILHGKGPVHSIAVRSLILTSFLSRTYHLEGAFEMPMGISRGAYRVLRGCLERSVEHRWTIAMVDDVAWGIGWEDDLDESSPLACHHHRHDDVGQFEFVDYPVQPSRSRMRVTSHDDDDNDVNHDDTVPATSRRSLSRASGTTATASSSLSTRSASRSLSRARLQVLSPDSGVRDLSHSVLSNGSMSLSSDLPGYERTVRNSTLFDGGEEERGRRPGCRKSGADFSSRHRCSLSPALSATQSPNRNGDSESFTANALGLGVLNDTHPVYGVICNESRLSPAIQKLRALTDSRGTSNKRSGSAPPRPSSRSVNRSSALPAQSRIPSMKKDIEANVHRVHNRPARISEESVHAGSRAWNGFHWEHGASPIPIAEKDGMDIDIDELDIIGATSSTSNMTLVEKTILSPLVDTVENIHFSAETLSGKRRRTAAEPNDIRKRQKMADKKSATIVINVRRTQLEAARRRWLYKHRDLFQPLLPSTSYFQSLCKEFEGWREKVSYVPFRALDVQPQLIQGRLSCRAAPGTVILGMNCVLGDDEGHKIKNSETNLSSKIRGLGSLFRLILTGTPVQNNLVELWGLLNWLYSNIFTPATERLFREAFNLERGSYSVSFLKSTQALLNVIMLRRTKDVIEVNIPPRDELTVFIPLTEAQRFWTYRLLTRMDTLELKEIFTSDLGSGPLDEGRREVMSNITAQMNRTSTGEANRWRKLMNLLLQLRKVCDHPYMLKDSTPSPYVIGEHIVASSSKLVVIDKILSNVLPKGERVLIFSQWTGMLDILEDFMELRAIPYGRLDGSTNRPRRTLDIKLFQQEKSPFQVFLISTKAGGLGINLTRASTVIMCDSDWNPQNDLQAIARAHRIGQTKIVKVFRLICQGSVEDQMLDRLRRKLFLSLKVMSTASSSTTQDEENAQLKLAELVDILRKGSSAIAEGSMDLERFLAASIDDILNESRQREGARNVRIKKELDVKPTTVLVGLDPDVKPTESEMVRKENVLLHDAEEEERRLLSGVAQVHSRLFEGRVVEQNKSNRQIAEEWKEVQKRARVDRLVKVDGISVVATHVGDRATPVNLPQKRYRPKYDSEDWCIYCRDGGEVVVCSLCPRVFHPECHGITPAQLKRLPSIPCSQHTCAECSRNTAQSGGMLFRLARKHSVKIAYLVMSLTPWGTSYRSFWCLASGHNRQHTTFVVMSATRTGLSIPRLGNLGKKR